jgi:4-hydroxyphenylpyruvate dioxygenase
MTLPFQPAIFSVSVGRAWLHSFDGKVAEVAKAGFKGIEIFYEDLEYVAREIAGNDQPSSEQILAAADYCYEACHRNSLTIIGLQPFLFYDGLVDRQQHDRMIEKMRLWLQIVRRLHTDIIQIPAHFVTEGNEGNITGDRNVIAGDLRELADMGSKEEPVVRFAYENLCWSAYINTWEDLWDIVKRVDRPNFGMCLDTFNISGRIWADPTSRTGKMPNADEALKKSLENLVKEVDLSKVFYIQIVDAEKMSSPLVTRIPYGWAPCADELVA